jgi:ABC-type dipeptide/oligopeptide/nickel transport system permease component
MHAHMPLIVTLAAALGLALVLGFVAARLKLPALVGYLLAGVLIGPHTPGFVADVALAGQLAEVGVMLLMFGVGLHFSLKDLLSVKAIAVPGAIVQIGTATLLGMGLGLLMGWGWVAGLVFGLALSWLPSVGGDTPWHYVLPTVTLAAGLAASVVRFLRGEMLEVMGQDHVRTARATGLSAPRVLWGHVARNAMLPVLTVLGLQLNGLINGSLIIETVFALPGIGQTFVGAVQLRDYPVLQFGVMAYALVVVVINLGVDALYAVADPRIRRGGAARMAEA